MNKQNEVRRSHASIISNGLWTRIFNIGFFRKLSANSSNFIIDRSVFVRYKLTMKNWSLVTNKELHTLTLHASKSEKSATLVLLEHLAEIDRRRLYAEMGFPSLWIYVHELLGYSESQTTERVSAMRLMTKVPEVKKELIAGNISLTTTSKLATHVRREKTSQTETLNILSAISGKSSREVDQYLAKNSVVEYKMDKLKPITSETSRIIIDVDQEFLVLMNRVRELKGHQGSSTQELLKLSMQNFVKRFDVKSNPNATVKQNAPETSTAANAKQTMTPVARSSLRAPEVTHSNSEVSNTRSTHSRFILSGIKNKVRLRSGDRCEYVDPNTQRRCQSKMKLEFDHIVPFSLGGQSTFENLRHLCASHNKLSAIRQFGSSHMKQYLKS